MHLDRRAVLAALCTLLLPVAGASAQGFRGGFYGGPGCNGFYGTGGYGLGAYWGVGDLYRVLAQNVPYYAAFPPVYYSMPVPRAYGYSPFAYLPDVQTPEATVAAQPLEVPNPYVQPAPQEESESAAGSAAANDQTTQTRRLAPPLTVLNPFVPSAGAPEVAWSAAR